MTRRLSLLRRRPSLLAKLLNKTTIVAFSVAMVLQPACNGGNQSITNEAAPIDARKTGTKSEKAVEMSRDDRLDLYEMAVVDTRLAGKPVRNGPCYAEERGYRWLRYFRDDKLHGQSIAWTEEGHIAATQSWSDGHRHGRWMAFYREGWPESRTDYRFDKRNGQFVMWYGSGAVCVRGQFKDDLVSGKWEAYALDGTTLLTHDVAVETKDVWEALRDVGILDPDNMNE